MTLTVTYPKIQVDVSIAGVASEATLQDINSNLIIALEELSKDSIYPPFFQDPNTITNGYQTILTVGTKSVENITVKQNDGNTISIAVNGVEKLICPPSGEVQNYPLVATTGQTIAIKAIGTVSNAGAIEINFLG